jgi:hypothetical protein
MSQKEFIESMKKLIPESVQSIHELRRLTTTRHTIYSENQGVFLYINEHEKKIKLDTPLEELPEALQHLVKDGEKAGYKIIK